MPILNDYDGMTAARLKTLKMAVRVLQTPRIKDNWNVSAPEAINALRAIIEAYDPEFQKG